MKRREKWLKLRVLCSDRTLVFWVVCPIEFQRKDKIGAMGHFDFSSGLRSDLNAFFLVQEVKNLYNH